MNMDILRDNDGTDWLIDFNPRAFGGGASFLLAGVDLSQAYLRSLGWRTAAPNIQRTVVSGVVVDIIPTCLTDAMRTGSYVTVLRAFLRTVGPYLRRLGLRYALAEALTTLDATRGRRRQDRSRSS